MSHKLVIHNSVLNNLEYIKICEDDCIIYDYDIIEICLKYLINESYQWELLSCFIADLSDDIDISNIVIINEKYKLLKINKWCSSVFNIYHKSAYKYFIEYDHKKANDYDKDETGNLLWTFDRFLKFKDIWVIYPFPVSIMNIKSECWITETFNGDNYNQYMELTQNTINLIENKLKQLNYK